MLNRPDAFIDDYENVNVESLGKPIHIIRENLESLISQSCSDLSYDFEKWLKKQRVDTRLKYVSVHHFNSDDIQQGVSCIFKHQSGGCLHIKSEQTLLMMLADHFYNAKTQRSKEKISNRKRISGVSGYPVFVMERSAVESRDGTIEETDLHGGLLSRTCRYRAANDLCLPCY